MSEKVTLIIKAANQSSVDQRFECNLDWNVQYVKEEISKTHPAKPSVQEQRLIYSGQLLQDAIPLRTVLRHPCENNEYTIHLVCSSKANPSIKKTPDQSPRPTPVVPPPPSPSVNNSPSETPTESTDGVRHRFVNPEPAPAFGVGQQQGFDPYFAQFPHPLQTMTDVQQMAMMQQMYTQYMSSYMQYIQGGNYESAPLPSETLPSPPSPPSPSETQDQQNAPQAQAPNNANEPEAPRNAQMRVNPQFGGVDEEEEGVARDWLDYIYFGSRMLVLLSIVYFYSTLVRFLLVACTTFFIYLYQCGWFRLWRVEEQQPRLEPEPPLNQAEDNVDGAQANPGPTPAEQPGLAESGVSSETLDEEGGGGKEEEDDGGESSAPSTEDPIEEGVQAAPEAQPSTPIPTMEDLPAQPSLFALSWTFLTTFFTSLIPEQQQIV